MRFKEHLRLMLKVIGGFLILIASYFISAFTLSKISINSDFKPCDKDAVDIYVLSNGIHTDLVLPIKNESKNWSVFVDPKATLGADTNVVNVAFGWGDKGFYLETKTWDDLKVSTAFNALFYLSTSAMHVTFYKKLKETKRCKKISINKESYLKLVNYISESFKIDANGKAEQIQNAHYEDNDAFYEANGTYSLFFTCNTWTNSGLKAADLKACLWTPYDSEILNLYDQEK